jgi:hypothetical protein
MSFKSFTIKKIIKNSKTRLIKETIAYYQTASDIETKKNIKIITKPVIHITGFFILYELKI